MDLGVLSGRTHTHVRPLGQLTRRLDIEPLATTEAGTRGAQTPEGARACGLPTGLFSRFSLTWARAT